MRLLELLRPAVAGKPDVARTVDAALTAAAREENRSSGPACCALRGD
jgi:hypothetical protein